MRSSLVAVFCREYLGLTLRSRSPKFFGSDAFNLDWLAKRRSGLWILLTDDIEVLSRGAQRETVRSTDVEVIRAGGSPQSAEADLDQDREPKLIRIEGGQEFSDLFGYYLRIPNSAWIAYGDVIQQFDNRAVVWAADKITLVASDGISTAFRFDIRLDRIIVGLAGAAVGTGGAIEVERLRLPRRLYLRVSRLSPV